VPGLPGRTWQECRVYREEPGRSAGSTEKNPAGVPGLPGRTRQECRVYREEPGRSAGSTGYIFALIKYDVRRSTQIALERVRDWGIIVELPRGMFMRYMIIMALAAMVVVASGCGTTEKKERTFRLLPEELAAFEAYTNPNVALYEEPEDESRISSKGKFMYLGWLAKEGIIPGNPFRTTAYTPYRTATDKDMRTIDTDMWWILKKRRERMEAQKKAEAARPRVYSY